MDISKIEFPDDSLRYITIGFLLFFVTFGVIFFVSALVAEPAVAIEAVFSLLITAMIFGSLFGVSYLLGKSYYALKEELNDRDTSSSIRERL